MRLISQIIQTEQLSHLLYLCLNFMHSMYFYIYNTAHILIMLLRIMLIYIVSPYSYISLIYLSPFIFNYMKKTKHITWLILHLALFLALAHQQAANAPSSVLSCRVVNIRLRETTTPASMNMFALTDVQISSEDEVALGVSRIQGLGFQREEKIRGWMASLVRKDPQLFIEIEIFQNNKNSVLTATIIKFKKQKGLVLLTELQFRSQKQKDNRVFPVITNRISTENQDQTSTALVGAETNMVRTFILVTGYAGQDLDLSWGITLKEVRFNQTHIYLRESNIGRGKFSFSLLVVEELQLLRYSLYVQLQDTQMPQSNKNKNKNRNRNRKVSLKEKREVGRRSMRRQTGSFNLGIEKDLMVDPVRTIELRRVDCGTGFWSIYEKQCINYCQSSEQAGQVILCRDEFLDSRLLQSCDTTNPCNVPTIVLVTCPTSIINCLQCQKNMGSGVTICRTCATGYYKTESGLCQVCPIGCTTCTLFYYLGVNKVDCTACRSTFTMTGWVIDKCECNTNQYMVTSPTPTCYNCPTGCSRCTSNTVCTACVQGYYMSAGLCYQCMPVCKTCIDGVSCSSCINSLVISGTICACASPLLLAPGSLTCISCTTFDANCQTCAYSSAYSASTPVPIICTAAMTGYFVNAMDTTTPCSTDCDVCGSATTCTTCAATFNKIGQNCVCSPFFLANVLPRQCLNCSDIVPGCDVCQTPGSTTNCAACISNYYPSGGYPTSQCFICPVTCSSCTSTTVCTGCYSPFVLVGSECLCTAPAYLNSAVDNCVACGVAILNCQTCVTALPTNCSACDVGFSLSADGLLCYACDLNCASCDATGCLSCNNGYTLNGTVCECGPTCQTCLAGSGGACSDCLLNCQGCAAGWHLVGVNCIACSASLTDCQACVDASTCIRCFSPFILNPLKQCGCNNTNDQFLTFDSSTCLPCATIVPNCLSCLATPATFCNQCSSGLFFNTSSLTCEACAQPCADCNGAPTTCTTCAPTYTLNMTHNYCYCDGSLNLFYSSATLGCSLCGEVIELCQQCQINPNDSTIVTCAVCSDPYYADSSNSTCLPCDPKCTSCSSLSVCSSCATNLLGNGTHCLCNTGSDPTLTYNAATNMCISCLNLLSNCINCQPQPLACIDCLNGSYLSGSTCLSCPSQCQTCNSTGCLTCPSGSTLSNGQCICGQPCLACQVTVENCFNCSTDSLGVVTQCFSCSSGTYLSTDTLNCLSCPSTCATCTTNGACQSCLDTFILDGVSCVCRNQLNLYQSSGQCQLCGDIYFGCSECAVNGTETSCVSCQNGMYLNGTECSYCSSSCLTCSDGTTCDSCPEGYIINGSACICDSACTSCASSVAQCSSCIQNIYGTFGQCTSCGPTFFLNSSYLCEPCPSACVTCDNNGDCTSCTYTLQTINGTCTCNSAKNMILNSNTNQCESCALSYPNCGTCQINSSALLGYDCQICSQGYYMLNNVCELQVCGDGIVSASEQCDDQNDLSFDGCSNCKIEQNYVCSGEPSACSVELQEFKMEYDSVQVSTTECNQLTLFFKIIPHYSGYNSANFTVMYGTQNYSRLTLIPGEFTYSEGVVGYKFKYSGEVKQKRVKILFLPSLLGIGEISHVPLYPVYFNIGEPTNSLSLNYHGDDVCSTKEIVNTYLDSFEYASLGVLVLSSLPAKIVGLELYGVIQLTFLSLGSMDHLNPLHSSFTKLSFSNGYKMKLDQKEPTDSRRLQTSALTPNRVQTIGYASNFLRNCNLMFLIVAAVMVVSFLLYLLTFCCSKCPCLAKLARRLFKEVLLTLTLFNCFNFAYCAGVHFSYADSADQLYVWGTIAAVCALGVPLLMIFVLQCTEDEGFGEYKDKLKAGRVEKAYFMVTILYRMGIGFYMASMNEDMLSTLIVLLFSIYFLIYNLVNLPFTKAYHNYRANICHLSQFLILYVTTFYRSMNADSSEATLNSMVIPVYLQLGALGLCLLVSALVLMVDICVWVGEVREWCRGDKQLLENNDTLENAVVVGEEGKDRGMSFETMKQEFGVEDVADKEDTPVQEDKVSESLSDVKRRQRKARQQKIKGKKVDRTDSF